MKGIHVTGVSVCCVLCIALRSWYAVVVHWCHAIEAFCLSRTVLAGKCFATSTFVSSATCLWSIGERCCQGYPALPAQRAIDDDSIDLGQIQWGTSPGHAHITGVVHPVEALLNLYFGAHKAAYCITLVSQRGGCCVWFYPIKTTVIKSSILALLVHKDFTLSCQWEKTVIFSSTYSVLYYFLYAWWGKKSFY